MSLLRRLSLSLLGRLSSLDSGAAVSSGPIWPQASQLRFFAEAAQSQATEETSTSSKYERADTGPASIVRTIVKDHGPLTVNETWELAREAGLKSKSHMKKMLTWLKERGQIELLCVIPPEKKSVLSADGEFFYRIPQKMQTKQDAKEETWRLVRERRSAEADGGS